MFNLLMVQEDGELTMMRKKERIIIGSTIL
jgi:hypothetical protein